MVRTTCAAKHMASMLDVKGLAGCYQRPIFSGRGSVLSRGTAVRTKNAGFQLGFAPLGWYWLTAPMQRRSAPIQKQPAHAGPANVGPALPALPGSAPSVAQKVKLVRGTGGDRSDAALRKISGCRAAGDGWAVTTAVPGRSGTVWVGMQSLTRCTHVLRRLSEFSVRHTQYTHSM
jgi:hypothetical protein